MSAKIISGKDFSSRVREKVRQHVAHLRDTQELVPGLAVVLVGEDPASKVYVRNKGEQTLAVGMKSIEHKLDENTSEEKLLKC